MLTFDQLRAASYARCISPTGFRHPLEKWSPAEWGNATAGECGEACNIAKKLLRFRDNLAGNKESKTEQEYINDLGAEIADLIIYADLWAASLGIDTGEVIRKKFNETSDKIGCTIKL